MNQNGKVFTDMAVSSFRRGLIHGFPIALGYLSVSFGFGILAVRLGLPAWAAIGISLTNLTSAGQVAGVGIIAAAGTVAEMIVTQLVINIRYALMGISLSQKLDGSFTTGKRMLLSFGITDEVYAMAASQPGSIGVPYMAGLIITPIIGWTSGTALGALAGELLPSVITDALGLLLYGMFLAIILPPAREDRRILMVILFAAAISCLFHYAAPQISGGFAVILSSLFASALGAWLFPGVSEEKSDKPTGEEETEKKT